jgi:hypothetical protein
VGSVEVCSGKMAGFVGEVGQARGVEWIGNVVDVEMTWFQRESTKNLGP